MKNLLIFSLLFLSCQLFSQTESGADSLAADDKVYEMFDVQTPPQFPGGEKELYSYLSKNIQYPAEASKNKIAGSVLLSFVVNKDGSISEVLVIKDIGGGCGTEARRAVLAMPNWQPGEVHDKPVRVRFTLPVRFRK